MGRCWVGVFWVCIAWVVSPVGGGGGKSCIQSKILNFNYHSSKHSKKSLDIQLSFIS